MLVLSRKIGERIVIADNVIIQVLAVRRGQIRLGITAPPSVSIRREELPRFPPEERPLSRPLPSQTPLHLTREDPGHDLSENHVAVSR
jgi:carbon storage regulator